MEALDRSNLDDYQKSFCSDSSRALRLLAPAGSGKTYSLLWRCLALAEATGGQGIRFLVFTFTRAGRDELLDRLRSNPVFRPIRGLVDVTTLNAWGYRFLKSRLINPRLVIDSRDQFFCMINVLQPVWQKAPKVRDVLRDARRKSPGARVLMELADRLKSLGFRHDRHADWRSFTEHCRWLENSGMAAHVTAILRQLEHLEIVDLGSDTMDPIEQMFSNYFGFWCEATHRMFQSALLTFEDQKY